MIKMYGGTLINENARNNRTNETMFVDFLNNCQQAKVISDSSISGIIVHLYNCPTDLSPYYSVRNKSFSKEITGCIIKLNIIGVCLDNKKMLRNINSNLSLSRRPSTNDTYNGNLEIQSFNTFNEEVTNTQKIFKSSFMCKEKINNARVYLEPICPSIIAHCDNMSLKIANNFITNTIIPKIQDQEDKDVLENFYNLLNQLNDFKKNNFVMGFICQEMMDGYKPLHEFRQSPKYNVYKIYAKFQLMRLSINLGVKHNDAHHGNVMINPNMPYFDGMHDGSPVIIDFGRVIPYNVSFPMNNMDYVFLDNFYNTNNRYGSVITKDVYDAMLNAVIVQNNVLLNDIAQKCNVTIDEVKADLDSIASEVGNVAEITYTGGSQPIQNTEEIQNKVDIKTLLVSKTEPKKQFKSNLKNYGTIDDLLRDVQADMNYEPIELDDCYLCFQGSNNNMAVEGGKNRRKLRKTKKNKSKRNRRKRNKSRKH